MGLDVVHTRCAGIDVHKLGALGVTGRVPITLTDLFAG